MTLYFFDTFENGEHIVDDAGLECCSFEHMRLEAMKALPAIAKDEIPKDGDRQAFTVLVKNEAGKSVYSATLTYAGLRLG
ncbi:MAG: hypothetical protein INR68_08935 [Methylobacterium mesophilicum]|nr:hypothetical protein [Methylobacterium mesophilicum]